MKTIYQHNLTVSATIAEDVSYAEIHVYRHYTDGSMESHGVVLTPADFDGEAQLRDVMRELLVNLAESV